MADPEIKIKRYADKENLKELMKYSKDTFATQSEVNEKFYTKEQIDTMLEVGDATIKINYGSTNLGSFTTNQSANATVDISPIDNLISENFYTKEQIDTMIESGSGGGTGGDLSNYYTKSEVDDLLSNISGGTGGVPATNAELDELTTEWSFE